MTGRDGYTTSLWQNTAEPYIVSSETKAGSHFDVIIVGGGITGISSALLLQKSGKKCLVLEARNLCFGTTGGTTAHINNFFDTPYSMVKKDFNSEKARKLADAARAAIGLIRRNITEHNIDCEYEETSAYVYAEDEQQEKMFDEILDSCIEVGLSAEETNSLPAPHQFKRVMKIDGQAKFHPIRYVYGLAKAFEETGGKILQNCRVSGVKNNEPVEVETTMGNFTSDDLIYATHTPPGINLLHLRLAPYRTYAIAFTLADENYPPVLYYDLQEPYHYFRSQQIDGTTYLIAGGKDHKTGEITNTEKQFLDLEAKIRKDYRVKEISARWSSQFYESTDGLPYIGQLPGFSNHIYVAAGFGGNGMTYSSIAAMIFRDMIAEPASPLFEGGLFNPSRIKPVAGFTEFVTHNAHVAMNFLGKIFSPDKVEGLSEIAPGEARTVSYEKEKLGIYKSEAGEIFAVSTTCTHMKCSVKWNNAEKTWDCPCHGARFDYKGNVMNAPADIGLEQINIQDLITKPE